MNILVTGCRGQLGNEMQLLEKSHQAHTYFNTDVEELDITDQAAIDLFVDTHPVDYIINCAAYTAVDRAEDDEATALLINATATQLLAKVAARIGARMIHVSTDYVFDGESNTPYREDDPPHPVSAYGRTKLAGEQALQRVLPEQSVILRTAWLYSPHGKNFVKTMLELGRTRDALRVVYDQVGSPTSAPDLARAIITVLTQDEWHPGIYHYTNEGAVSWYDFTNAIHRLAGITTCDVQPCRSHEFPAKAHRPAYSVLDKAKFKLTFGVTVPYWEESLKECIIAMHNA